MAFFKQILMAINELFGQYDTEALEEMRDIDGLIRALGYQKHVFVRADAAGALGEIGDSKAVDALIAALNDRVPVVREAAAGALGEIGDSKAVDALIAAFNDEEYKVRTAAVEALGKIGSGKPVDALIVALKNKSSRTREEAAKALDKNNCVPDHGENYFRYLIAKGDWKKCIMIGSPTVDALIDTLNGTDSNTKSTVARVLGEIGDSRAVNPLIEIFHSRDVSRRSAAMALAKIGDPRAMDALIAAFKNNNKDAAIALGKVVDFNSVRCSKCKKELEHLGEPTFSIHTLVLGSPSSIQAIDQWRGNVCIKCQMIFCPDCIKVGYPTPCPKCSTPTKPALRGYLENLTELGDYNKS